MIIQNIYRRLDHIGISLSLLCAIHCAALPLVLTALPLIGLGFLTSRYWEFGIIAGSFIIGCTSLIGSYIRLRLMMPMVILAIGFAFIVSGQLWVVSTYEWVFMVLGGLLVAAAHFYNWKLVHKSTAKPTCCIDSQCPNA